ncbi:hypothetical protein BDV10DRAFT_179816 [Aspergillus recurvatus]
MPPSQNALCAFGKTSWLKMLLAGDQSLSDDFGQDEPLTEEEQLGQGEPSLESEEEDAYASDKMSRLSLV